MPRAKKTNSICAQRRALEREAKRLERNRIAIEKREKAARERAEAKASKLRERHKKEATKLRERHEKELAALGKGIECPPAKPRASRARRTAKKSPPADDSSPAASRGVAAWVADRPATVAPGSAEPKVKIGITKHPAGTAGITDDHDGIYAVTPGEGKSFKTLGGAARWLKRRNYNADGTRIKGVAGAPTRARISVDDLDRDLATRAYAGTSHTPERRAEQERAEYVAYMEKLRGEVLEAGGDLEAFESFRAQWLKRKREQLSRRQGLMSSMIVGPARFPVAQQRKRSDVYDRKQREFAEWTDKQRRRLLGLGKSTAIRSTDDDAIERLQEKLAATEAHREVAKKANALLRKKKLTDAQKRAALADLGLSESTIKTRMRFGPFIMANISSEARRIEQRIAQLRELAEDKARGRFEAYERGPWTVTWDDEDGRVRVEGPKPATREATRAQSAKFKARGFRWSPRNQAYQRQSTENAWHAARSIVDELAVTQDTEGT